MDSPYLYWAETLICVIRLYSLKKDYNCSNENNVLIILAPYKVLIVRLDCTERFILEPEGNPLVTLEQR